MIPLNDWTQLHRIKRRLYRIHDVRLPVPVGFVQGAAAGFTLLVCKLVLGFLGVGLGASSSVLYLGPAIAVFLGTGKDMVEGGRTIYQWTRARVLFLLAPRALMVGSIVDGVGR